jgi:hypothetical protein
VRILAEIGDGVGFASGAKLTAYAVKAKIRALTHKTSQLDLVCQGADRHRPP